MPRVESSRGMGSPGKLDCFLPEILAGFRFALIGVHPMFPAPTPSAWGLFSHRLERHGHPLRPPAMFEHLDPNPILPILVLPYLTVQCITSP
jgi:hypothetical protein